MEIKKVLETVFLPEWNTTAQICEDGSVYIMFRSGIYTSRLTFDKDIDECMGLEFRKSRLSLFDELEQYYEDNFLNK